MVSAPLTVLIVTGLFAESVFTLNLFRGECCEDYCFSTDTSRPLLKHLSSDSAYQLLKGNELAQHAIIPNCKATKFWFLGRHGTRLPELEEIQSLPGLVALRDKIITNYEVKKSFPAKGALCHQDIQLLKSWTLDPNITIDKAEHLTTQGWNDLKGIARDYKSVFPELLGQIYNSSIFLFRHTNVQRTEASYKAFVEGLFGDGAYNHIPHPDQPVQNSLLLPMKYCPAWKEDMDTVESPGRDVNMFELSETMMETLEDISKRLGFTQPLTFKQVELIYNVCAYETAWFLDRPSPWCAALTRDQVKVFEYENDLFYHFRSGYGNELNENLPCEIVQDMLSRFSRDTGPKVMVYFSHSTLLQMFATALGLFKDAVLLSHSNYAAMESRRWRSSKMDPFASNYAVVKYNCSDNQVDPQPKVRFFLNQSPLQIDGCDNGVCNLEYLLKKYERFVKSDCLSLYCARAVGNKRVDSVSYFAIALLFWVQSIL